MAKAAASRRLGAHGGCGRPRDHAPAGLPANHQRRDDQDPERQRQRGDDDLWHQHAEQATESFAPPPYGVDGLGVTVLSTTERQHLTAEEARAAGERIGIDWNTSRFDVEQFRMGMDVELEHGTHDVQTNVTDDDVEVTAKIARAHLNEFPDYYSRLAVMEAEAEAYWEAHPGG